MGKGSARPRLPARAPADSPRTLILGGVPVEVEVGVRSSRETALVLPLNAHVPRTVVIPAVPEPEATCAAYIDPTTDACESCPGCQGERLWRQMRGAPALDHSLAAARASLQLSSTEGPVGVLFAEVDGERRPIVTWLRLGRSYSVVWHPLGADDARSGLTHSGLSCRHDGSCGLVAALVKITPIDQLHGAPAWRVMGSWARDAEVVYSMRDGLKGALIFRDRSADLQLHWEAVHRRIDDGPISFGFQLQAWRRTLIESEITVQELRDPLRGCSPCDRIGECMHYVALRAAGQIQE